MEIGTMVKRAYDNTVNNNFSKAKPYIRSMIGDRLNVELGTRSFKKVKCEIPELPDEED